MVAWKLTTEFDNQRHLFSDKVATGYIIETYICSCGDTNFILKHPEQNTRFTCKECENTKFYDANSAWRNIAHFLYQNLNLELSYEYDIQSNDETISSFYVTRIPKSIDFSNHKVIYSKRSVSTLTLTKEGELKESYLLRFDQKRVSQLKNNLTQYINKNSCFNIPDAKGRVLTLTIVLFFLKNPHLRDIDFYYWDDIGRLQTDEIYVDEALMLISNSPESKSIKKILYQNYLDQLADNGKYISSFVEAFSNNIKDINVLSKLLKLNLEYFKYLNINKENLDEIIAFLKRYYSEKQLLKFFSSKEFNANHQLFRDAVNEFLYSKDVIKNKFKKTPCKLQALHDEFVRCVREERHKDMKDQKLAYSKQKVKACIETNTYQVKLPNNGEELFDWADDLHNCMAGYFYMIKNREIIIYGFFQDDTLKFAVEISDNEVIQASGKYNANLTTKESQALTKWFNLFFSKEKQRLENVA